MSRAANDKKQGVWPTPDWLWQPLDRLLRFDLDAAASRKNGVRK